MTIGDFMPLYEKNHVAFLKNRLGTSRRLLVRAIPSMDVFLHAGRSCQASIESYGSRLYRARSSL